MTAVREALVLPLLFSSVFLLGGLRIASPTALSPPSVFTLVMALLLLRVLVQSGTLAPARLMSPSRSPLANLNGLVVLFTLWAAGAQTLALLTPDSGLPNLAVSVLFPILFLNTAATAPDRQGLLRSLAVIFGATFVVKFVVLFQLSSPGTGMLKRMLLAVLEGVTLGALIQDVPHPMTGYVALFTVVLFLFGVFLLPEQRFRDQRLERATIDRQALTADRPS